MDDAFATPVSHAAGPAAEPVLERVGELSLYRLSSRGQAAAPGYWAGFKPGPEDRDLPATLSLAAAWAKTTGAFVFCDADPVPSATSFVAGVTALLPGGTRLLWIGDPLAPHAQWKTRRLTATLAGGRWTLNAPAVLWFAGPGAAGYRLTLPQNAAVLLTLSDPSLPLIDVGGLPFTLTAPGGAVFTAVTSRASLPLAGAGLGTWSGWLGLPATPPSQQPDGFTALGVELRYTAYDPAGGPPRSVAMPVLRQGNNTIAATLAFDPLFPLLPARSRIDLFSFPATPPREGPTLDSLMRTVFGYEVQLQPYLPAGGPLRSARLVFCTSAAGSAPAGREIYLAPDGAFRLKLAAQDGPVPDRRLLLGMSGGEYALLPGDGSGLVHFDAGRPGHLAQAEGAAAAAAPPQPQAHLTAPPPLLLTDATTTAYLALTPSTANPSGLVYHAQSDRLSWYAAIGGTEPAFLDGRSLPAGNLPALLPGAAEPPAALPVGIYTDVDPALAETARRIEEAALAPLRRAGIAPVAQPRQQADSPGAAAAAVAAAAAAAVPVIMLSPSGLRAEALDDPSPAQAIWHRLTFAHFPGADDPDLAFTEIGPQFRAALQSNELFLVVADPDVFMGDTSVPYRIDPFGLIQLRLMGMPQPIIDELVPMLGQGYDNEEEFDAAVLARVDDDHLDEIRSVAGLLRVTIEDWVFQLSPRSWRTRETAADSATIMLVKSGGRSLAELVGRPAGWSWPAAAGEDAADTARRLRAIFEDADLAAPGTTLHRFATEVVHDPGWNGVLFLNAPLASAELPDELAFLTAGVDPDRFYAHHVGFSLTALEGGASTLGRTGVYGLIDYRDPAPQAPDHTVVFAFKTRQLTVGFTGGAVGELAARVELMANRLFGSPLTMSDPARGNNLVLSGSCQRQDGAPAYAFALEQAARYDVAASMLSDIEVTGVEVRTSAAGAEAELHAVDFSLSGLLRFNELPGFDAFCYGPADLPADAPEDAEPADGYLRFSGLSVRMSFPPGRPGEQSFQLDEGRLAVDPANSVSRPDAPAARFPIRPAGVLAVPGPPPPDPDAPRRPLADALEGARWIGAHRFVPTARTASAADPVLETAGPQDLGFQPVLAPAELSPLRPPWYGLLYDLDLGSVGALAGSTGLSAELLAAWAPGEPGQEAIDGPEPGADDDPYAVPGDPVNPPVYLGLRFADSPGGELGKALQGVLRFGFRGAQFTTLHELDRTEYLLRLDRAALSVLGLSLPPGNLSVTVFGDPHAAPDRLPAGAPGWYAAYRPEDATAPTARDRRGDADD